MTQTQNPDTSHPTTDAEPYPDPRYAWYMVGLLTVAYVFSFVDRYVLGLLVEPIKADLGLTDTQIGLLLGPAFAIFYATMGLPLGWLADRKRRTWIVGIGVAVWSAATAASGLAKGFWHMFIARMCVGVGEATLSPCAMSMISDSFPPEKRGRPIAFYTAALSLGAGIASLVSASVLIWAKSAPEIQLPLIGVVAPWQLTFFIVGLPGLGLAALFFVLKEPKRRGQAKPAAIGGAGGASLWDMLGYVGKRWAVFGAFLTIFCYMTIIAYSQGWLAATFIRTYGWSAEQYAYVNAIVTLSIGPLAVNISGWLSDKYYKKGVEDAPLVIAIIGAIIILPTGAAAPLMPTGPLAFFFLGLNTVGIAMVSATGVTALLNITPREIRAQTVAFYFMCISLAGLLLGPTAVGLITDMVFGEENIRYSMALLPVLFGLPALALAPITRRNYNRELQRIKADGAP
ncbi:MAG: MFS transporter [Pseudomonadota bacterium]